MDSVGEVRRSIASGKNRWEARPPTHKNDSERRIAEDVRAGIGTLALALGAAPCHLRSDGGSMHHADAGHEVDESVVEVGGERGRDGAGGGRGRHGGRREMEGGGKRRGRDMAPFYALAHT